MEKLEAIFFVIFMQLVVIAGLLAVTLGLGALVIILFGIEEPASQLETLGLTFAVGTVSFVALRWFYSLTINRKPDNEEKD